MESIYTRTEALIGKDALERLKAARVIVFGVGGVGGFAVEALARAGVGSITVVDHDTVSRSNLNRQIIALESTVGKLKVEVVEQRIIDINPLCEVSALPIFYSEDNAEAIDLSSYDVILDCIDSVRSKLYLIESGTAKGTPVISSMGTGNKLDPTRLRVSDISKTEGCPLARVMRKELRARGINHVKVVWSDEKTFSAEDTGDLKGNRPAPASAVFVPATAGLILAAEAVREITK